MTQNLSTQEILNRISRSIPQTQKHECQHIENGACLKCRFPITWFKIARNKEN